MKLKIYSLFGCLALTLCLHAQIDFQPGYIINLNGDTIVGEIDYRGDALMGKVCSFKDASEKTTQYFPNDIDSFRFTDGKYYISKTLDGKKVFLEYLIKGKINMYYLRDDLGDHYYFDKEDVPLTELPYESGLKRKEGRRYKYESVKHIGLLNIHMQDAPGLRPKIESVNKPTHKSLISLAKDYHNAVCDDEGCTIYEKPKPAIQLSLEPIVGFINFRNDVPVIDQNYLQYGVLGHIGLPRLNDKWYLRTGVTFSNLDYEFGSNILEQTTLKIPIQVEFMYPGKRVSPRVAFGFNIYDPIEQTVAFMGGANINLLKNVAISVNYDIDFFRSQIFAFAPTKLYSSSLTGGLFIQF